MRLRPSPVRKTAAPSRSALRALLVSACALTAPAALGHPSVPRRLLIQSPTPATHPYLALLTPTPLRFAAPSRPPAVLKIDPLPEEQPDTEIKSPVAPANRTTPDTPLPQFNFALPPNADLDLSLSDNGADGPNGKRNADKDSGPPPILLDDDSAIGARPEDVMPFFRLPSNPSSATYRLQ